MSAARQKLQALGTHSILGDEIMWANMGTCHVS
jgi:hypothetical protein